MDGLKLKIIHGYIIIHLKVVFIANWSLYIRCQKSGLFVTKLFSSVPRSSLQLFFVMNQDSMTRMDSFCDS